MTCPQITPAEFVTNFPAFADPNNYPTPVVQFFLSLGYDMLSADRWGVKMLPYGVQLFAAHNLVLEFQAQKAANKGAPPGLASGPISSQSGGPLSMSWDTGSAAEKDAGHWNSTTYGQRYIRMARLMGAGGMQLGVGRPGFQPLSDSAAWAGPPPWPGWFSS